MDQLLGLFLILDNQSVQVSCTSHLELGRSRVLLDSGRLDVGSSSKLEEEFDVLDFFLVRPYTEYG